MVKPLLKTKELAYALKKLASKPLEVSCEAFTGHLADQVTHKWKKCEWERSKWMTSETEVKQHNWLRSVPDEMQVPAKGFTNASRGQGADLRAIFT